MASKNFPGVIGMLDGCHIPIKQPKVHGASYFNRKSFYSIVLQGKNSYQTLLFHIYSYFKFSGVCRKDLSFTDVFVGFPGRVHDSRILSNSPLFDNGPALCGNNHVFGDSAYPNINWIMTPFCRTQQMTLQMTRYNGVHSSIRIKIEQAFGMLKGRFRRLKYIDQDSVESMCFTICTACVLHNICIWQNDFDDIINDNNVPAAYLHGNLFNRNLQLIGNQKRNQIMNQL